jgi:methionine-rich copper-binding protein CopC
MPQIRKTLNRFVLLSLLAVSLVTLMPGSKLHAHASVVSVSPAQNSTSLSFSKGSVFFNEPVSLKGAGIQLINSKAKAIAGKASTSSDRKTVSFVPVSKIKKGTYVMRWSVISIDGHVIIGSSAFYVGDVKSLKRSDVSISLSSKTSPRITVTGQKTGPLYTLSVPEKAVYLEMRSLAFKTAVTATLSNGKAVIVLPHAGSWNVHLKMPSGEFATESLFGKVLVSP